MAQAVPANITPALSAADVDTQVNREPRILDVRLGEALGFALPRMVRKLIRRHFVTLREFGEVCSIRNEPGAQGGRPSLAYYLNKRQALYITAKSDTERAALVTVQMVEVFDAVTNGVPPHTIPVRADHRRLPQRSAMKDGRGCIMIGGDLITFEAGRRPAEGALAVLAFADGHVGIATIPEQHVDRVRMAEPGFVMVDTPGPHSSGVRGVRERAAIVGIVTATKQRPVRRLAS